ncbi:MULTISPECIES: alcohol dehydrogenase catalytic domain-containing protein [Sphingobium]|jgi:threonine dehydrogenase-like Zn-dependent dehydrogenase|uniref:Alcohol dehydrogenase catalytic domain-containing protein n=1 Tax=Sphingobium fuliginis (strain ATCC 27551) TaxID=336203 RepID=A0A4Q4IXR3_SPHSA|nr:MULTISPECIES: alcohol dehydrogenase catalytic domain-containing protein [Sphingobium]AJR23332.1 alcohol dehydrogenase [Sphingobium sp. YBL2]MCB4861208.1 alcohol dehydrogenase catalytic domain-containing protein [Sphingobium sp. PNB]QOT74165.1 alcohol dehydrogenase catalytic domain-containing protein [Sphingobium fuliginis]RYL98150.1 alcohol dehydrogenase [Sphingobium fuliginis]WDA34861.1 alcohol dehydrogenase catalytic domain-containing protein [Sphingobium sp. YC-XJ3]
MRAALFKGAGTPLVVETIDDPQPGEGEAVIKVTRCGVCGTDLHMTSGHGNDFPVDSVIGHEYCGEVVALGKGVDNLKVGQFVTAMPVAGCGRCAPCLAGYPMACAQMQGLVGGFSEYMRIAATSSIVLPDTLTPADGALIEPLAVGLRGIRLAQMPPGAKVAVLGAGSIGLAAIYWARLLGAGKIVAISRSSRRADLALQMGANSFEALGEGEAERVSAALGGMPDIVLECVGAVGMTQKAVELVAPGGTVVSLGFCTSPDPILPSLATWKQVTIKFSFAYDLREFEHSANALDAGHVEPRLMVSRTVGLDAFPDLFEQLRAGANETKIHVDPWSAA